MEDYEYGGDGIYVDLIPSTCWGVNVVTKISTADMRAMSKIVFDRVGNKCECCTKHTNRPQLHERWRYTRSYNVNVQQLVRLMCVCKPCMDLTYLTNYKYGIECTSNDNIYQSIATINKLAIRDVRTMIRLAHETYEYRNNYDWTLNLNILTSFVIPNHVSKVVTFHTISV